MNKILGSKLFKIVISIAVVICLTLSVALPAFADNGNGNSQGTPNSRELTTVKGKVTEIAADKLSFVVQPTEGDPITITVDANTKYYLARVTELKDIKVKIEKQIQEQEQVREQIKERFQEKVQNSDQISEEIKDKIQTRMNERGMAGNTGTAADNTNTDEDADNTLDELIDETINENLEDAEELEQELIDSEQGPKNLMDRVKAWFGTQKLPGEKAAFADIEVGIGVVVRVMPNENLAKQVLIIKATDVVAKPGTVKGIITDVTNTSITIKPADADAVTIKWDANTAITLKGYIAIEEGLAVSAIYNTETMIAKVINVKAPEPTPTATATPTPIATITPSPTDTTI